jgi:hypothetical protein
MSGSGFWNIWESILRNNQFPFDLDVNPESMREFHILVDQLPTYLHDILQTSNFDTACNKVFSNIVRPIIWRAINADSDISTIQQLLFSMTCSVMYIIYTTQQRHHTSSFFVIEEIGDDPVEEETPEAILQAMSLLD